MGGNAVPDSVCGGCSCVPGHRAGQPAQLCFLLSLQLPFSVWLSADSVVVLAFFPPLGGSGPRT